MLAVTGVHKTFFPGTPNEVRALQEIECTIEPGSFTIVIGTISGEARSGPRWFRMPIDRSFTVEGHGTVVTGSVLSGSVKAGASCSRSRQPELHCPQCLWQEIAWSASWR